MHGITASSSVEIQPVCRHCGLLVLPYSLAIYDSKDPKELSFCVAIPWPRSAVLLGVIQATSTQEHPKTSL